MNVIWQNCWCVMIALTSASANVHRQPNIIFIMADDMGWNDVSFHGSDQILTPNIDTLAYQGVVLQQYYSEAICTPARTALLTGKYPMRMGMHGFPLYNSEDRGIPLTERLLPSYMKELGYATHLVGKWHVGMSKQEYLPTSRGYDTHYGMRGGYVDYYTYNKVEMLPNGQLMFGLDLFDNEIPQEKEQRYIVDALTDRAVKIIHRHNSSRPLFLHVAHNAPHSGNNGAALQPPLYSTVKQQHIAHSDRRLYAEVVSNLDRSIGRLVTALADRNLLDDTIIVFASDNGAPTIGDLNNLGVNLPFRGTKYTPWEGGVRVPAFIWHSSFRPRVWEGLMHITDWLPTLIAAAGGEVNKDIDGVNQWNSIVQDGQSKRREVLISVEDSDRNVYAAYRAGDYKIIIGNVTGVNNNYYGEEFLINKATPPEYFSALRSCEAARTFEYNGIYLDSDFVKEMRSASTIKQQDTFRDPILCEPSATSGCLFNVRRDPMERHNLWDKANKIAALLMNRLRSLWALQQRRGPQAFSNSSDPANFGYIWTPWIYDDESVFSNEFKTRSSEIKTNIDNFSNQNYNRNISKRIKDDAAVKCEGMTGVKSFLCILRSVL